MLNWTCQNQTKILLRYKNILLAVTECFAHGLNVHLRSSAAGVFINGRTRVFIQREWMPFLFVFLHTDYKEEFICCW